MQKLLLRRREATLKFSIRCGCWLNQQAPACGPGTVRQATHQVIDIPLDINMQPLKYPNNARGFKHIVLAELTTLEGILGSAR